MSDSIDRAAEAIEWHFTDSDEHSGCALRCGWGGQDDLSRAEHIAQALDHAGLLTTPERDAEQRRAGAVEALREAAEYDHEDHATEIALGGDAYVHHWLAARAERIEAKS